MENIQNIRSRIRTVRNIHKAATAMKLISTIKLAKIKSIPFNSIKESINILEDMLSIVAGETLYADEFNRSHWMLRRRGQGLLIVLSTDQGFCGSFKQSILNEAEKFVSTHENIYLEIFGKKMGNLVPNIAPNIERLAFSRYEVEKFAQALKKMILSYVLHNDVTEVYIISGEYINVMTQVPHCIKLFPLKVKNATTFNKTEINIPKVELFDLLFEKYLYSLCYNIVYEHLLSELSIRVFSMDKTVRNADEITKDLTLLYNRTRQTKITQELTEIVASVDCIQ